MYKYLLILSISIPLAAWPGYGQPPASSFSSNMLRHGTRHFGVLAGYWFPMGDLDVIGSHPSIGMQWGFRHLQHEFDLTLDFRFLNSRQEYYVNRDGLLYYSRGYTGGYIGLDYKLYFIEDIQKEVGLLAGVGYDGFSLNHNDVPKRPYEIGSLNLNAGIRINIYTKGETYFGVQSRYNLVRYGNKGGTSFLGNAITVDLFVGGLWN